MNNASYVIQKHFPQTTSQQAEQFGMLESIYTLWNSRINVISRKDIDALYERHVLHSLAIAKIIDFADDAKILDVGTGGGFPGIPLAILFPQTNFHLIDSVGKKLKVVDAVVQALQLKNVTTQHTRAENTTDKYDFIVSRAVASLSEFIPWTKGKFLKQNRHPLPNGILLLKGGNLTDEISSYLNKITVFDINKFFSEPFFDEKKIVYVNVEMDPRQGYY